MRRSAGLSVALLLGLGMAATPASAAPPVSHHPGGAGHAHSHHIHTGNGRCVDIASVFFNADVRGLHRGADASRGPLQGPYHGTCDNRVFPGGPWRLISASPPTTSSQMPSPPQCAATALRGWHLAPPGLWGAGGFAARLARKGASGLGSSCDGTSRIRPSRTSAPGRHPLAPSSGLARRARSCDVRFPRGRVRDRRQPSHPSGGNTAWLGVLLDCRSLQTTARGQEAC